MEIATAIISVGILVFLAHFFAWLFGFVRIPDVLMLMCVGIFIGPVTGIVAPDFLGDAGDIIIMLILVMILFEGSVRLKIESLQNSILRTFGLAFTSFFLSMIAIGFVLWQLANLPAIPSFLIGAIVGSNSTAIVIPLIQKMKIKEDSRATLVLESGLSDVLSIIFTLALISSLEIGSFHLNSVAEDIFMIFLISAIIGGIFALLWSLFLNKIHNIKDSAFTTPAFVFIVFGVTDLLGYGGFIAVIVFGIVLGNIPMLISSLKEKHKYLYTFLHPQPLSTRELSFFREIVFLVKIFFFIFIGISLNFQDTSVMFLGLSLAILLFLIRIPAILSTVSNTTPKFDASIMAVTAPRGLAPAVLALIPIQRGLEGGKLIQDITYSVIFFSILFASLLIFLLYNTKIRNIYEFLLPKFASNPKEGSREYPKKEEK